MDLDNSIILINKPPGHTSHEITTFVKKITKVKRTGHAGTLDPEVSGVLPIALGRATKLLQYIAAKDKTYVGIIKFKIPQTKEQIESLFSQFKGEIIQTPPKISAVRKVPRKRIIYELVLLEIKENIALFRAKVDAGTYIRTLCEDIGKKCGGARMEELRRIAVGSINETQCFTMYELIDAMSKLDQDSSDISKMLIDPSKLISLPRAYIKKTALKNILTGAQIMGPAIEKIDKSAILQNNVAIYCENEFVGVGTYLNQPTERGICIKIQRIHYLQKVLKED